MNDLIDLENIEQIFKDVVSTPEWKSLQEYYNQADNIFFFGHGGNMAVADHAALNSSRLTNKNIITPSSSARDFYILVADADPYDWIQNWVKSRSQYLDKSKCLAVGFSCSLNNASANSIVNALNWAYDEGMPAAMISAQYNPCGNPNILKIVQNASHYHTSEILSLTLTYQLIKGANFECPQILQKCNK
tara:strand:- start:1342 stop:1911 length:570 start_codon:yes stop_codon:yes gene_type:complete